MPDSIVNFVSDSTNVPEFESVGEAGANPFFDTLFGPMTDTITDGMVDTMGNVMVYALWIPILFIILSFIIVGIIIYIKSKENRAQHRLRMEMYLKALEMGKEVPEEFLKYDKKDNSQRTGIILLFLGIGIVFMGIIDGEGGTISLGIIPLLLGVGFLIIHKINRKQQPKDEE